MSSPKPKSPVGRQLYDLTFVIVTSIIVGIAYVIRFALSFGELITFRRR